MAYYVYILYSRKLDRFYTGNTELDPEDRLRQHKEQFNAGSFTTKGIPWELFLTMECSSRLQARRVESHIKRMKSRTYIRNLSEYQEMKLELLNKYS